MKARTRTALALALVLAVAPVQGLAAARSLADTPSTTASAARLDTAALERAIAGLPADDATAAVVRVGGRDGVWRGGSGVHDLATGRPAVADGRFRAGSVTKVFTAAVVLQLVAEGAVALDRPVAHYLPGLFPDSGDWPRITVAQLLNHTSGIQPADGPGDTFAEVYAHRFDTVTPEELIASATSKPLEFVPGKGQHYLNINYTVLGLLIEKVTGDTYEHQVRRRVLSPLGLRDTYLPGGGTGIRGEHNLGYQRTDDGRLVDVTDWNMSASWAAGDIVSTAADLERFTDALFTGRVVPPAQFRYMLQVPEGVEGAEYTMGLTRAVLPDGTVVYGKSGSRYGYTTWIAAALDDRGRPVRTLVASVNSTDAKSEDGGARASAIALAAFQ